MSGSIRFLCISAVVLALASAALASEDWHEDLSPLEHSQWSPERAAHLLERAGFGGTPAELEIFSGLTPKSAVDRLVRFKGAPEVQLASFDHSGVFKPGLDPFPPSRPATTNLAKATGEALGIKVKAGGNRPVQPIVNEFFYWLRASRLETDRVAYWWANRMLISPRPLVEKMALFWHGHFATNEDKVRDYRKMLQQLELFQAQGLGNFRELLIGVAQDPAMLAFLDAGVNVKGRPNENFAREIMELFTMGVGHYGESDVREAARAFTGWNFQGLQFVVNEDQHDDGVKTVLGRSGNFDGVEVIDLILEQPATARYIASKLYRHFVRSDLSPEFASELGERLESFDYELAPFMAMLFSSKDFYSSASVSTHIKSPVELVISTYRKLGLDEVPGVPDFNTTTGALGQRLLHPPTVAGWSGGRSWITPGLLFERGNFVLNVMFPDITFIPADRYPVYTPQIIPVYERLQEGMDITNATRPTNVEAGDMMAASNLLADRDEAFNTRYGSYRGWQMAIEKVKPIPRSFARVELASMVLESRLKTPEAVVEYFGERFLSVALEQSVVDELAGFLESELGSRDIAAAGTYLEEPLRVLLHLMLSLPEYQLG